jgi:hypothetical protein
MGNHGKIEARITIPAGGWTIAAVHSVEGSKDLVFVAGDTYYWSDKGDGSPFFLQEWEDLLNVAFAATFTVTGGFAEDGTGKMTVAVDSGTIVFSGVFPADAVTLTGELDGPGAAASITATNAVKGLWLAPTASNSLYGALDAGWDESDYVATKAPDGTVVATRYNRHVANRIEWQNCPRNKVRTAYESTTNEAFQTFYRDVILGEHAAMAPGGPIRWHPDADSASSFEYKVITPGPELRPQRVVEIWTGLYPVVLDRLIQVPS